MTKVFNKRNAKRITAILLAVVAVVSSIFIIPTASAAGKEVTVTFDYCYDTGGNIISFVKYTEHGGYTVGTVGEELCRIYADGKDAYCIEPGHSLYSGNTLTTDASAAWNALSKAQKKAVNLALLFGKSGSSSSLVGTDGQKWIATQLVVWEFCTGYRDASTFKLSNSKFIDGITSGGSNPNVKTNYNKIIAKLNDYNVIPSFSYDTQAKAKSNVKELKYSDGKYTLTLTDSNKILSDYTFKKTGDVSVSVSGNKITLTSSKAIPDAVVFSATKNMPKVTTTLVACGSSSKQDVVTGVQSDTETKTAYFAVKTSDDGKVDGVKFKITGADNYSKTVTTNSKGEFQLDDLKVGTYTVTEVTEERYEDQKAQTVKVESGKTATVKFSNVLKRGNLQVVKSSEDNFNEGVKFHLYGTSLSGAKVDEYATTDKNGIANFKNILVSGDNPYTLEEVDTSIRYVVPKSQTAPVVWDKATKREFINVLKKFTVTVEKTDAEAKKAQGDATLAGAKYGIYESESWLIPTPPTRTANSPQRNMFAAIIGLSERLSLPRAIFSTKQFTMSAQKRKTTPLSITPYLSALPNRSSRARLKSLSTPIRDRLKSKHPKKEPRFSSFSKAQGVLTKQRTVSVIPLSATKRDTQNQRSCLMALTPSIRPTAGKADTMLTTSMYSFATALSRTASSLTMLFLNPISRWLRWTLNQERQSPTRERDSRFMHPIIL